MTASAFLSVVWYAAAFLALVAIALLATRFWRRADAHPLAALTAGQTGIGGWLLTMAVALAAFMGVLAAWLLVFVAFICFLYSAGLAWGEIAHLLGELPPTAGNVLFHATFPAQMFLMGLFLLLLVLGPFQLVLGPLPATRFAWFRVDDVAAMVRRLALVLGLVAALELARTVMAGSLLAPEGMLDFFARNGETPLADPTGLALLAASVAIGAALVFAATGRRR